MINTIVSNHLCKILKLLLKKYNKKKKKKKKNILISKIYQILKKIKKSNRIKNQIMNNNAICLVYKQKRLLNKILMIINMGYGI